MDPWVVVGTADSLGIDWRQHRDRSAFEKAVRGHFAG